MAFKCKNNDIKHYKLSLIFGFFLELFCFCLRVIPELSAPEILEETVTPQPAGSSSSSSEPEDQIEPAQESITHPGTFSSFNTFIS